MLEQLYNCEGIEIFAVLRPTSHESRVISKMNKQQKKKPSGIGTRDLPIASDALTAELHPAIANSANMGSFFSLSNQCLRSLGSYTPLPVV